MYRRCSAALEGGTGRAQVTQHAERRLAISRSRSG
jgi:hypothetical protein